MGTGYHEREVGRYGPAPEHELEAARRRDEYEEHRAHLVAGPVVDALNVQTDRLQGELIELREDMETRADFRAIGQGLLILVAFVAGFILAALL